MRRAPVMRRGLLVGLALVMRRMVMWMLGGLEVLFHQVPAAAVPHDLLVGHLMTLADRLL